MYPSTFPTVRSWDRWTERRRQEHLTQSGDGSHPQSFGRVKVFGRSYQQNRYRVGYVPQRESVDWDFPVTALDVVAMGLYSQIGWFRPVLKKHREAALEA